MSRASDYAAAIAADRISTAEIEATRPASKSVGHFTFNVNREGGLNLVAEGLGDENLSVDEVQAVLQWLNSVFM